ncbi:COMM domain-containing protein 10 [Diachasma alloeum]|uniref:COMM domain-containing protein 10 n=1 Tax=Diachasma alloeum TaxID=454923 RepID=UPI00073848D2|nr:COMM domain-containing protein 10 [Diachasma alloeum]XP_015126916.1 COMM domain-containing protein 10 [Diachasma alloeum]XP_015126925.1 COMM domain-containing protein 10 [Diachasma alloeum]
MTSWITVTPRLQQGLEVVTQIDNAKFRPLVNRICQSLNSGKTEKAFSQDEEEKLLVSLNVKRDELDLLLDTITLIYSQAAFGVVKPAVMESVMKESFPVSEDKVSIFVNAWITYAKGIIDVLRHKSIFPSEVEDVKWTLNIPAASSAISLEAKPSILLQLDLTGTESKRLTVEMDKSHLTEFYNHLEKIQSQLDALK